MIEVRRILKRARLTSIYVTHDQAEAFAVADQVAIMNAGRIEQIGAPSDVYARPASEFVARFLGLPNLIEGTVISQAANIAVILTPLGHVHAATDRVLKPRQAVTLLIRPDAAIIDPSERFTETPQVNVIEGELLDVSFRGRYQRVVMRVHEIALVFEPRSAVGAGHDRAARARVFAARRSADPVKQSLVTHHSSLVTRHVFSPLTCLDGRAAARRGFFAAGGMA